MYKICRLIGTYLLGDSNYIIDLYKGTVSIDHIKGAVFKSMIFIYIFSVIFSA